MSTRPPPRASRCPAPPPRFLLPLGLAVVVVVVLEAGLGPVGFGSSGRPLLLTASAAVYAVTGYAFLVRAGAAAGDSMTCWP